MTTSTVHGTRSKLAAMFTLLFMALSAHGIYAQIYDNAPTPTTQEQTQAQSPADNTEPLNNNGNLENESLNAPDVPTTGTGGNLATNASLLAAALLLIAIGLGQARQARR
jgi:hypothetical protein